MSSLTEGKKGNDLWERHLIISKRISKQTNKVILWEFEYYETNLRAT